MQTSRGFASSGVPGLDQVLGGGFPSGQVSLLRGASGVGKTTLSLQFLMEGARIGEAALYLGTSETEQDIRHVAASHGWSLQGVSLHHHEHQSVEVEQTMLHPAEVELPRTIDSMLSIVKEISPKRVVIDSLAEFRVLARDELWYRRQLMTLKQFFSNEDCTVLLIELGDGSQPVLDSIVSGVVQLDRTTPLYGPDRRRLRVSKIRGQQFTTGFHDYVIHTGGLEVFPRLTAAEHRQPAPRGQISTGMPGMDTMLGGGLTRGTSILLLGPSGTGKSVMATRLAVAAAERGERSALFVFDERVQTLFQRAEGIGLPLEKYCEKNLIQIRQIDPAELTSGEFSHTVRSLVEDEGIQLLVIDSLNGYAYAMPQEQLLSLHLHELASYLNQKGVTSIFTATQHGLVSPHGDQPFDVSYLADTVILFRHFEFGGQLHKAVSVYKSRGGPHETAVREFTIDSGGIRLGEPLKAFRGILSGVPEFLGEVLDGANGEDEAQDG
jgi:circadian clock protein KaiC